MINIEKIAKKNNINLNLQNDHFEISVGKMFKNNLTKKQKPKTKTKNDEKNNLLINHIKMSTKKHKYVTIFNHLIIISQF